MKRLIFFLLVLALAVWLGLKISADPGYTLLSYGKWSIEMPLWLSAILALIIFFTLHYLIRLSHYFGNLTGRVRLYGDHRRLEKSRARTRQGLIELNEGNWANAERSLIRAVHDSETPLINYLSAARAAQEQAAYDRRDRYLRNAHESTPGSEIAVGLTQAELQIHHGQYDQALATLRHLQSLTPNHKHILTLLKQVYVALQDWENMLALLPACRKYNVLPPEQLQTLEKKAYLALLDSANQQATTLDPLTAMWARTPKALQKDPELLACYAKHLIRKEGGTVAEDLLKSALKKQWDDHLVELYGQADPANPHQQLLTAEGWLKRHKDNPILLLTLGRICKRNKLWGKARSYFEASATILRRSETYVELGQLLEQLGEHEKANEYYRRYLTER